MSSMVKVWNDNKYPFEQKFKDAVISIPPGKYVEMDWDDAVQFKGLFYPPEFDGTGQQKPTSYKMIRVDGNPKYMEDSEHNCAACGDRFASSTDLESHIDRHHLDDLEDRDVATKRRRSAKQ